MNTRPVIDLPKTTAERWFDVAAWLFVALSFALVLANFSDLPDVIPNHFNAAGKADGYGSKYTVFLLPGISFLTVAALTVLLRFPQHFNYMTKITPENAAFEYKKAKILLRVINVLISLLMLLLTWNIVQAASGQKTGLNPLFWVLIAAILIAPFFIMFWWKDKSR